MIENMNARKLCALARRGPIGRSLQRAIEQRFSDVARLRNAGSDLVFLLPGVCLLRLLPGADAVELHRGHAHAVRIFQACGRMASASPRQRFAVIGGLAAESTAQVTGIPVDIRNAPVIPGALQFEDNFLRLAMVSEGDCAGRLERTDSLDFDR